MADFHVESDLEPVIAEQMIAWLEATNCKIPYD